MSESKSVYGGQAVIEGVMFGTGKHTVTAVRHADDSLSYYYLERQSKPWAQKLKKSASYPWSNCFVRID
ncbi:hypothetical protein BTHER_01395 [Brochothrix thermosphacta DSM 20171 = FSL F6-1036]|nr:hypothetical protein BTHER_01395 [Brochothrix thermosphacta DSM 20171 = FSL F6-1036]